MVFVEQLKNDLQILLVIGIVFGGIILLVGSFLGGSVFSFMDGWGFMSSEFGFIGLPVLFGLFVMIFIMMGSAVALKHFHNV